MNKQERRIFSDSLRQQMVKLHLNGKSRADIIREYELTPSTFNRWINQSKTTGSFKEEDNLSDEARKLRVLRKHVQQLEMENDVLKQAALIIG
ncbi:transposase [Exiguobacterium sp. K1]|uniref:transposase n=1 Tax=Exiguobacterium sp. K1 TaxID=2980105 RepID=UPI00299D19FA|nr:transposase [Exiguobacterium sp. K1]MDX1260841.1 helix-turn-helix domain-containing protein [Exiguobacterium sp. K1]